MTLVDQPEIGKYYLVYDCQTQQACIHSVSIWKYTRDMKVGTLNYIYGDNLNSTYLGYANKGAVTLWERARYSHSVYSNMYVYTLLFYELTEDEIIKHGVIPNL